MSTEQAIVKTRSGWKRLRWAVAIGLAFVLIASPVRCYTRHAGACATSRPAFDEVVTSELIDATCGTDVPHTLSARRNKHDLTYNIQFVFPKPDPDVHAAIRVEVRSRPWIYLDTGPSRGMMLGMGGGGDSYTVLTGDGLFIVEVSQSNRGREGTPMPRLDTERIAQEILRRYAATRPAE